jgi:arsenical pump membrane protein
LDTTVVLLTPVVVATARAAGVRPRPHTYACGHLANSGSLLLPVSNLTNLLALAVVPISFLRFAALMALPWAGALLVELVALLRWFRRDLDAAAAPPVPVPVPVPRFALAVVALTLAGFVAASLTGLSPVWVAVAGALVLVGWRLLRRRTTPARVVASAAPSFCLFVLALGVVVRAASDHGLGAAVRHAFPSGNGLAALLLVALFSAAVANLVNNLPATLLLLPVAATGGVGPVLAVLVGVNIGPNLTYAGSLATLLWRRVLADSDAGPRWREFSAIGAVTTPLAIGAASLLLWLSLRAFGAT